MVHSPIITLMEKAARTAGESLKSDFSQREKLQIESKKPGDFVSQADHRSEEIVVAILTEAYPDWGILGEEGTDRAAGKEGYRWIIDPLDGTTNFLHGVPHWSVTIALEKQGEIIAGLTFDPFLDELFYAEKGKGAFLNGKKLQVSDKTELKDFMISVNIGFYRNDIKAVKEMSTISEKIYQCPGHIQGGGGLALELCYLAAGRFDLAHCWMAEPWDYAAGLIIVKEAGGIVTNIGLSDVKVEKSGILAGNAVLHSAYTKLLGLN